MHPGRAWSGSIGRALAVALFCLVAALSLVGVAEAVAPGELAVQSIDTTGYPTVVMRVVLPGEMLAEGSLGAGAFQVRENGTVIDRVDVRPLEAQEQGRDPLNVVLVVDVSGSMKGKAIQDARRAATAFVDAMGPSDKVALVAFSDSPRIVASFTSDGSALKRAILGLRPGGETALYDAASTAAEQFKDVTGADKAIVMLSDGGDTTSGGTLDSTAKALTEAEVPLYAVALRTDEYDPASLRKLGRASGGRLVSVRDSATLAVLFEGLAEQLHSPYEISFTSSRPPTKDLEIDLVVTSRDVRASANAVVPNPEVAGAQMDPSPPPPLPSSIWPLSIAAMAFLAVGLLSGGVMALTRPMPNSIEQLKFYEQLREGGVGGSDRASWDPDSVGGRLMAVADSVASRGGFSAAIRTELERAGLPLRPVEYMTLHLVGVILGGMLAQMIGGRPVVTFVAILVLALGPILAVLRMARKRMEAFQAQLPDVLNLLAGSMRSGWGLLQAVGIVVSEMKAPAGPEFARVVTEARLGLPLEDALGKMADRMGSDDFRWAVTAISIQRDVGGNLAEVLDIVAETVRERATLRRQISSLTAEGRLSSVILLSLPFVEAAALYVISPGYLQQLFASSTGIWAVGSAALLLVVGAMWLRRVVKIEV